MKQIRELNVCGACKHSIMIPDIDGRIAWNLCRIGSSAVNKDGGLTYCTEWAPRRKLS